MKTMIVPLDKLFAALSGDQYSVEMKRPSNGNTVQVSLVAPSLEAAQKQAEDMTTWDGEKCEVIRVIPMAQEVEEKEPSLRRALKRASLSARADFMEDTVAIIRASLDAEQAEYDKREQE